MEPEPNSPEQTNKEKAEALHAQVSRLVAAEARLSGHSRAIPAGRDFHFYNNFDQFRSPAREIDRKSADLLGRVESSAISLSSPDKQQLLPPLPDDLDDVLDRVVSLNDEALEMYGAAMDEFGSSRERQEKDAGGGRTGKMDLAGGFQMVIGKKKKKNCSDARDGGMEDGVVDSGAKVASRDTKTSAPPSRVPFHISSIPRPQDEFKILVNNSNQPFEHVWLERSEDGSRFIHPLEKLSASDFIDRHIGDHEPIKPPPLENTPFKLVEGVKELKELAAKLRDASEFAVDLEHNHYRSFQGLTCLMQISTRTEDFVVDTLKLRIQIGPHLREVFKDPSKRKVMHGANRDILWLQRDFGIYVCNLFDTGQASRVLQLERNSLEYLLRHYCGVTANKEYQNAEWRLRPLPVEMLKYAREDTHYLLYLYDVMSRELLSASTDSQDALLEVYNRSYDICMELYEKELLTDTSYLYIYGLHDLGFNSQQLAVVAGLCEWRDTVARAEDESTGYILPNKLLLQIARQLPLTAGKLRRLVNFKHPFVERYLGSVVSIIKSSMQNAPAFEGVVEELNKLKLESMSKLDNDTVCSDSVSHQVSEDSSIGGTSQLQRVALTGNVQKLEASPTVVGALVDHQEHEITEHIGNAISVNCSMGVGFSSTSSSGVGSFTGVSETSAPTVKSYMDNDSTLSKSSKVSGASIQVLKKPSGAFGALLGSSSSRNKRDLDSRKNSSEQAKAEVKLQEIKSSVSLPFYSFSGSQAFKNEPEGSNNSLTCQHAEPEDPDTNAPCEIENLEEVIPLESESDDSQHSMEAVEAVEDLKDTVQMETVKAADCSKDTALCIGASENGTGIQFTSETNINDESSSLAELSSDFHQCFKSIKQAKSSMTDSCKPQQSTPFFQFKPFDYAAARKQMNFGGDQGEAGPQGNEGHKESKDFRDGRKGSQSGTVSREARGMEFQPPRRRQAFPPTGNRNATFRQ